jgi:hypothetical protein
MEVDEFFAKFNDPVQQWELLDGIPYLKNGFIDENGVFMMAGASYAHQHIAAELTLPRFLAAYRQVNEDAFAFG